MSGRSSSKKNFPHSTAGNRSNNSYVYHPGVVHMTPSQLLKIVTLDHCYALPSAPQEKKTPSFPVRFLFQSEEEIQALNEPKSKLENLLIKKPSKRASQRPKSNDEEEIDVSVTDLPPRVPYDPPKAKNLMVECEKNVNFARMTEAPDNWEENIVKIGWTKPQKRLFNKIIQVLHDEHLARLAYADSSPEPLFRRLSMDKTAQKFRSILTQFSWDTKLIQWLHGVLVDNLSLDYLAEYLDILQTLKTKIPTLIDRMITLSTSASTSEMVNAEALNLLLKRPWDPFATSVHPSKIKKPPPSIFPIFIVVPSGPPGSSLCPHRLKSFLSMLSGIGKVVSVNPPAELNVSVEEYTEKMLCCTKAKVAEVITGLCDKPVYLMGWGNGSVVAAMVSLEMSVSGVICLGFPMYALTGTRLDVEDPLHGLRQPTMFVIGDRATNNCVTDMEIFRKELSCVNALSIVCHADSLLRVTNYHQKRLLVTQSYIDKCIVEEISWFLTNIPILEEELKVQAKEEEEQALHFDGPRAVPANSSASKRKSYHRPANKDSTSSPNYATASKLIHPPPAKRKQSLPPIPIVAPSPRTPTVLSTAKSSSVSKIPITASPVPTPSPIPSTSTIPSPSLSPILKASLGHPVVEQSKSQQSTVLSAKTSFVVKTKTFQSGSNEPATPANAPKFLAGKPALLPTIPDNRAGSIEQWKSAGAGSSIGYALSSNVGASPNSALKQPAPLKPTHLSSSSAADDSQILRRLITSSAASSIANGGGVINSVSSPITLPQDTTATLSSHPMKSVPKLPENASGRADHAQRLQFITSLLPNQQSEPGKSTILSLQHPNMTPQIIRITPINVPPSPPIVTTASSSNSVPPQERPLPTRCTDESLTGLDPSEGLSQKGQINPELFQHLKSTLSVSKDKPRPQPQPVTKTVQPVAIPVTAEQLKSTISTIFVSAEKKDELGSNEGQAKLVPVSLASSHVSSAAAAVTPESAAAETEKVSKCSLKPSVTGGFALHVQFGSTIPGASTADKPLSSCNAIVDKLVTEAQSNKVLGGTAVPQESTSQPSLQTFSQRLKVFDETQSGQKELEEASTAESGTKLFKEGEASGQRILDTVAEEIKSCAGAKNLAGSTGEVTSDKTNRESCPKPSVLLERINVVQEVKDSVKRVLKDHAGTSKSTQRNEESVLPNDESSRKVVTVKPPDEKSSLGSAASDSKSSTLQDEEHPASKEKVKQSDKSTREFKADAATVPVDDESTSSLPRHSKKSPGTGNNSSKHEEEVSHRPNSRTGRHHTERRDDSKEVITIDKTPVKRKHDDSTRRRTRQTSRGESDDGNKSDKGNEEPRKKKKTRSSSSSSSRRSAQTSPETIEILSSDDELTPRLTRSKARSTPQSSGERKTTNKDDAHEEATEGDDDNDSQDGDDDGTGEQRKKHLKPIHPVTPASLSATRTRKISIPKFYAFGM